MKTFSVWRSPGLVLLCLGLSACEPPAAQPDVKELKTDIEQLENQIGRLEFRIFELEQALNSQAATAAEPTPPSIESPAADDRYDLTPVE